MLTQHPGSGAILLVLALAMVTWPLAAVPGSARRTPVGNRPAVRTGRARVRWAVAGVVMAAVLIGRWAGWPTGVAAALVASTTLRLAAAALRRRRLRTERTTLGLTLEAFCRELRAGTTTQDATELAAAAAGEPLGSRLRAAVLQAEHPTRSADAGTATGADTLANLVAALQISDRHGVPLADLVEVIADDAACAAAAEEVRIAQTAGPRFSGFVLGALPLFGVVLGIGIGADPVVVLLGGSAAGSVLLVLGTALVSAGLLWSARIVAG